MGKGQEFTEPFYLRSLLGPAGLVCRDRLGSQGRLRCPLSLAAQLPRWRLLALKSETQHKQGQGTMRSELPTCRGKCHHLHINSTLAKEACF